MFESHRAYSRASLFFRDARSSAGVTVTPPSGVLLDDLLAAPPKGVFRWVSNAAQAAARNQKAVAAAVRGLALSIKTDLIARPLPGLARPL